MIIGDVLSEVLIGLFILSVLTDPLRIVDTFSKTSSIINYTF